VVCEDDLAHISSKEYAIRTICSSLSGLKPNEFRLRLKGVR
jgi:hypothetical protein